MAGSQIGTLFQVATFGESHGLALGGVVDGCPAGLELSEADLQGDLNRRRPGQSRFTTQRQERDEVKILSGVFEGRTTGTPIGFIIENEDQRSKDYSEIKDKFRPGHADFTYWSKYGNRDYRGGGRSSARETAIRVAAGAIAKKLLRQAEGVTVRGALTGMGPVVIEPSRWDWAEVERNHFFSPDAGSVGEFEAYLEGIRKAGNSVGAFLEVHAEGVPIGLGEPVFDRLDADLAKAVMSINAVKGVEIGAGMASGHATGVDFADEMRPGVDARHPEFVRNHAGGILGGISTGQPIVIRFAVKPTSSILVPRQSVDVHGQACEVVTKGRHDPCVGIRAVPIAEAMVAMTLADHWLRWRASKPL
ncbi:chorismate synthase [Magnetococcus marinus MC-1]|uniref:Chorismate synthase n=1 Tax=Magnetococcus marinus (strain ATCC BAA-1437 / JCM 17883 / MC-1) TaxID=156889 RepID=AROC_MAGMM|nr:chorismate synthase [Magnetococcus marinus]A0LDR1.1 RecName: Full=Chorismate synthase; Short=CS; AltName: Full=5-enolpyruvylshikimate-3-phosphate phospholyase [Magnetococcus marinus MC-1]ABK46104.1 chorismate synthase [Magnetococcus marinus MC-1]